MKKICLLTVTAAAMCLLSGCCVGGYSNLTGCMLKIDQQVTVAHLSSIKDNAVWEAHGNCYINTPVHVYELNNKVFNQISHNDYFLLNKEDTDLSKTHWVKITPEVKDFLCNSVGSEQTFFQWTPQSGKLLTSTPNLYKANKHNIKLSPEYRIAYRGWDIKDIPEPGIKLEEKESGIRYYLLPAALVTFPLDVVITVSMHCPIIGAFYLPLMDDRKEIYKEQHPQIQAERRRMEMEVLKTVIKEAFKPMNQTLLLNKRLIVK